MPKTNFANKKLQAAIYGAQAIGTPATFYAAWSTTTPNQDGSNFTEPVGNGYARVALTNNQTNFPTPIDNGPSGTTTWAASTAYAQNATVFPATKNGYYYQCTTAGTSGATAPTWPTTVGATVTDGTAVWTCKAAQGAAIQNGTAITFPQATGAQGTPTYFGLFDASSGGNLWEYEPITGASVITTNTTFSVPANNLTMYNN